MPAMSGGVSCRWLLCGLTLLACGCEQRPTVHRAAAAREVMGTLATLTAVAADEAVAAAAVERGYARLEDVNRLMSDYTAESEIGRVNQLLAGQSVILSTETFQCIRQGLEVGRASGGAFDITCRPFVALWKKSASLGRLPTEEELARTRQLVGPDRLILSFADRSVSPAVNGVQVDLGGIAKGYALDLAAAAMRQAGAASVCVDVGGDVLALGSAADGRPWRIGVKHPFQEGLVAVLLLSDRAVATSGVQQRFHEIDGRRYSHIIDPRTGWPAEQAPSVTVIAADGITADAWATAFSVLSIEEGRRLIAEGRTPDLEVMWIIGGGESPAIETTDGFGRFVAQ